MTFSNVADGHNCNCLDKAIVATHENIFLRRLNKQTLIDKDFQTHIERGRIPPSEACDDVCGFRGISIDKTESMEHDQYIFNRYKVTFSFKPKTGDHCLRFKLKSDAGLIKHDPIEGGDYHYNFFKSDEFSYDLIEALEIIKYV